MGHTGLARLCLARWDYRTRTELTEEVREAPTYIGRGGCHSNIGFFVSLHIGIVSKARLHLCVVFFTTQRISVKDLSFILIVAWLLGRFTENHNNFIFIMQEK